jgi:hypothetical protein
MNKCTIHDRHVAIGRETLFYFHMPSMANSAHFIFLLETSNSVVTSIFHMQ